MSDRTGVIPVDHRNLRAFYARGIVTPARLTTRYKSDALLSFGDALPVFPTPMGSPWIADGDDGFTVLMELGDAEHGVVAREPSTGLRLLSAPLPVSDVVAVHARSDAEAAEISARDYRNLDPSVIPLRVSPGLFQGAGPDPTNLQHWIESQIPPTEIDEMNLIERECVAGALALLVDGVEPKEGLLEAVTQLARGLLTDRGGTPSLDRLAALISQVGWVADESDARAFHVVARAIVDQSGPEDPAPTELLEAVADVFAPPPGDHLARLIDYISEVIRGEREFTGFRSTSGDVAMKALLLFLLRPGAGETRSWFAEPLDLGDDVRAVALLFSGLSHRFAGVPSGQKGSQPLQAALQRWICGRSMETVTGVNDAGAARLVGDGDPLAEWQLASPSLRSRLLANCSPDDPEAVRIALAQGWDDCLETVIEADRAELGAQRGKAIIRIPGRARVTHRVRPDSFTERLQAMTDADVDAAHQSGPAPARPRRRPRARPKQPPS